MAGQDREELYRYDRSGNRTSRITDGVQTESYSYNNLNELVCIEGGNGDNGDRDVRRFTYDPDGNMVSDGRGIYRYDGFNRMSEAVMSDGRQLMCRYDGEGLRHETEEDGKLARYIYSGRDVQCIEEEDRGITRFIRGNGRIAASDSELARTYYHYSSDALGSIICIAAGDEYGCGETGGSGADRVLCRYNYDAFGNTVYREEKTENRFGFTGELYDGITGLYYLRARYYCPETGRFTQPDSYHGDGLNLYVYAGNNPVRYVDPSGFCKCGGDGSSSGLPVDKNGNIVFYHGTTAEAAASIRINGVDLNHATRNMDFGRGFYVTTDKNQAIAWAERLGNKTSGEVVVFEIPESDFNKLNNKLFDSPDAEWGKTVVDGRKGVQPPYDTVSGPMLINVTPATQQDVTPEGKGQQTTFLSEKSIDLLNTGMKGKSE